MNSKHGDINAAHKQPFALSLSKGKKPFREPFMVRQAHHERLQKLPFQFCRHV